MIDGYIGNDPTSARGRASRSSRANANIAGMQQKLYFPRGTTARTEPEVQVIYTPNLRPRATRTTASSRSTSSTASRAS